MMDQKLCEKKYQTTSLEVAGTGQIVLNSLTSGASFLISNLTSGSHKDSIIKETPLEGIWPQLQSKGIPKQHSWSDCQLLTPNLESKASLICKNISNPRLTQGVVRGGTGSQISPLTYSQYSYSW